MTDEIDQIKISGKSQMNKSISVKYLKITSAALVFLTSAFTLIQANAEESVGPKAEVLLKSDKSWDDTPYKKYPAGKPQFTVVKIKAPVSMDSGWQQHAVPNAAYVLSGKYTVIRKDTGKKTVLTAGEALPQMTGNLYRGTTDGEPAELLLFYAGAKGIPVTQKSSASRVVNKSEEQILLQSEASWDGVPYHYPVGDLELSMMRLTIPSNTSIPWHWHEVPEIAYVISGELTVEKRGVEATKVFKAGEAFAETMGRENIHRGKAGDDPVVMLGFFAGKKGTSLLQTVPDKP